MTSKPIIQVARLTPQPGQESRLAALLAAIRTEALEKEPGCLDFKVVQAVDKKSFICWEVYVDEAAQTEHAKQEALAELVKEIGKGDLLAEVPDVRVMEELDA